MIIAIHQIIISMFMLLLNYTERIMKDNKINLNEYKVNYPNSEKIYKQLMN